MRNIRLAAVVVATALAAGTIGATAGMALGEPRATRAAAAPAATVAAPRVPAACTQAIARADSSIAAATRVADELAEHTEVMDQLIAAMGGVHNGMTQHKAFTYGMTSLNSGRVDRRTFAKARAAYADIRKACSAR
jgi:hypothetical protein